MQKKLQTLRDRLMEIGDLKAAEALLGWDQMTYMPPAGAEARGRQMATLGRLAHEKLIDPAVGKLLDELAPYAESLPFESDEAGLIRATRREYERAAKVPPTLMAEITSHTAAAYEVWARARQADDFAAVRPHLEKTLELSRAFADCFPGYEHMADPLIDLSDYGMKASLLKQLFAELRAQLVPLVQAVTAKPPADDACLRQSFPEAEQLAFGVEVIKRMGFDFNRARQDKSPHPFTNGFAVDDVRITTRVREHFLGEALFSTLHEAGHALYELGVDRAFEGTPLGGGTSSGVHESQSRLWENIVGRSLGFWRFQYPKLQAVFPEQLGGVSLETFYRAINKVEPSLIRTDADELTYNLHVMIRFDLELALLEGSLAVKDLPEAWRERYRADLGLAPADDKDGAMQDVHWYGGLIGGAFQGYTLGNILGAQFYACALAAHPGIPAEIEKGEFGTLHGWLREHIYRHGSKFTPEELVERACGGPMTTGPYLAYLREKFGQLYGV